MNAHTALEIADKFDDLSLSMRTHNVPTLPKLHEYGKKATDMLRQQHAEIDRLKRERHHIYDLLARIHRDGGQYTAEHGVEKSCDDAEAQAVTWIETIGGADALIEQARIAEREACAVVCDDLCRMLPGTKSGSMLHFAAKRIRARLAK